MYQIEIFTTALGEADPHRYVSPPIETPVQARGALLIELDIARCGAAGDAEIDDAADSAATNAAIPVRIEAYGDTFILRKVQ